MIREVLVAGVTWVVGLDRERARACVCVRTERGKGRRRLCVRARVRGGGGMRSCGGARSHGLLIVVFLVGYAVQTVVAAGIRSNRAEVSVVCC